MFKVKKPPTHGTLTGFLEILTVSHEFPYWIYSDEEDNQRKIFYNRLFKTVYNVKFVFPS